MTKTSQNVNRRHCCPELRRGNIQGIGLVYAPIEQDQKIMPFEIDLARNKKNKDRYRIIAYRAPRSG